jgi:hypothetical protein
MPPLVLQQGQVYCGACSLDFTAALFHPPEPVMPRPQPRALEDGAAFEARCARHAGNAAAATCERCGAFMCTLCRIDTDGKVLCAACFDRLRGEGALESARTSFRSWRTLGFHLSVLGLFVWPFGIAIGPASVVATIRGMAQDRKSGDEGGRLMAVAAILLGGMVTLMGAFFLLSVTGALGRGH